MCVCTGLHDKMRTGTGKNTDLVRTTNTGTTGTKRLVLIFCKAKLEQVRC